VLDPFDLELLPRRAPQSGEKPAVEFFDPFASASSKTKPPEGPAAAPADPAREGDRFASLGGPLDRSIASDPFGLAAPGKPGIEELFGPTRGPRASPVPVDLAGRAPRATPPPPSPAGRTARGPVVPCRGCGVALRDPLDAALGICEKCRAQEQSTPELASGDSSAHAVERVSLSPKADPFGDGAEERRVRAPAGRPSELPRRVNSGRAVENAMRPEAGPGRRRLALAALAAAAAVAVGLFLARPAPLFGRRAPRVAVPPALGKRLMEWKLAIDTGGDAREHAARGRRLFLEDKPLSYLSAEGEFKAAASLDPSDLTAVAHFVEAFAVGRGERAGAEAIAEAREVIGAVLQSQPQLAAAHRAKAELLLATDDLDLARDEAEKALKLAVPDEQAQTLLTVGRTYLKKSADIAQEKFEGALKKDRSLKRAYTYRGLAAEYAGRYAQAIAAFQERLQLDPDQREALRSLARVRAELGDYPGARKALAQYAAKYPDLGEPRVLQAQVAYAVGLDAKEADRALRALKPDLGKLDDGDKLQYLTLAAAVARERGDAKASAEQAAEALRIDPRHGPAHFQAMLTALVAGEPEPARRHLQQCEGKLDPARAQELLGRIEAQAGRLDAALAALRRACELSPSRLAPRLSAAALLYRKKEADAAWMLLRKALELDPTGAYGIRRPFSDYYEPPIEEVRLASRAFEGAPAEDWLAQTWAAIVQYHLGDLERAGAGLDRSLQLDPSSLPALLYRAQLELDRMRYERALELARRAVAAERQSGVSHYLLGRALEGLKKPEEARSEYLKAVELGPNLIPANVRLGAAAAAAGEKAEARKWLLRVFTADPENLEARAGLFGLGY
jgi:tetratricopeptide (TPR) repeat protein